MRILSFTSVACAAIAGCSTTRRVPDVPSGGTPATALVGGTVYEFPGATPIRNGAVLIKGERIAAVGSRATVGIPTGTTIIDVTGLAVLPAFWNSHVHFIEPKWAGIDSMAAPRADSLLRDMFTRFGFVHVFDLSSSPEITVPLRRRIRDGELLGPDILTTLMGFVPRDGTPRYVSFRMPELADADAARDSASARLALGADGIKLFTVPITKREPFPVLPLDVVRTVSDEAHARRKRVFAHPTNMRGVSVAVAGGVDILAHSIPSAGSLPDSVLDDMYRRRVAVIPTLTLWEDDYGPDTTGRRAFVRAAEEQVRAFAGRGGRILFGTDVGYLSRYDPTREYELMVEAGLDFGAVLSSLTTAPAEEFGLGARAGQLATGFDADIVVVDGEPDRDIRSLAKVRFTVKRGRIMYLAPKPGGQ